MQHCNSPTWTTQGRQPESETLELIVGYCAVDARRQSNEWQSAERACWGRRRRNDVVGRNHASRPRQVILSTSS